MSKKSRELRAGWVALDRCFVCGAPIEPGISVRRKYCLTHYIRHALRTREIFFVTPKYKNPTSRVARERRIKRAQVVAYLRARFIALQNNHVQKFTNIRDALIWIDGMWNDLHLHHSFVLRTFRLGEFVRYLFHLDHIATVGWHAKGWNGPLSNRKHSNEDGPREVGIN